MQIRRSTEWTNQICKQILPIAFGESFFQSPVSINSLVLYVSFATLNLKRDQLDWVRLEELIEWHSTCSGLYIWQHPLKTHPRYKFKLDQIFNLNFVLRDIGECEVLDSVDFGDVAFLVESVIVHVMGWLRLVGSIKLQVSFAEYPLFYRALLQKRPIILSILLTEATP